MYLHIFDDIYDLGIWYTLQVDMISFVRYSRDVQSWLFRGLSYREWKWQAISIHSRLHQIILNRWGVSSYIRYVVLHAKIRWLSSHCDKHHRWNPFWLDTPRRNLPSRNHSQRPRRDLVEAIVEPTVDDIWYDILWLGIFLESLC